MSFNACKPPKGLGQVFNLEKCAHISVYSSPRKSGSRALGLLGLAAPGQLKWDEAFRPHPHHNNQEQPVNQVPGNEHALG